MFNPFKVLLLLVFLSFSFSKSIAQKKYFTKYYDSLWLITAKDSATYYAHIMAADNRYWINMYYAKSNNLYSKNCYLDSTSSKHIGSSKSFYETGQLKDSSFYKSIDTLLFKYEYDETGRITDSMHSFENGDIERFHYYKNGTLHAHYYKKGEKEEIEAYDESGVRIKNFIYGEEAEYEGGRQSWSRFLQKNLRNEIAAKNGAPRGMYRVIVRFQINENGEISGIRPETKFGYGMEEEVIKLLRKSPKWKPAIWLNKKVVAYRRQPITFIVDY